MGFVMRGIAVSAVTAASLVTLPGLPATSAASAPAAAPSLDATSADGAAFDLDEFAPGDVVVRVTDAGSAGVSDTQDLRYSWRVTPFGAGAPVRVPATGTDVVTDEVVGEDGAFAVPLPTTAGPGTYVLTARLLARPSGNGGVPATPVLTVKAGQAALSFTDADPLRTPAGADRRVTGTLLLEDGTALGGRVVDLAWAAGTAGSDAQPDAGLAPVAPATAPVASRQVTTTRGGAFAAVVRDPAEDPQGTELGGRLTASTPATDPTGLDVDLVRDALPAGTELSLTDLGDGTPGRALGGTVTVTAPDDTFGADADSDPDPVEGQRVTLSLDHGFLTSGEARPSVEGTPAGDLVDLGTEATVLTDASGEAPVLIGIGRDEGFDDDGLVDATLTATAGETSQVSETRWSTADPLNGRTRLSLTPRAEQDGPVAPSLAGNRTYYDVLTLDQFGNPVDGQGVDLTYIDDIGFDGYDYSDDFAVSDLDRDGDIWVAGFEAGSLDLTGTWADAPTTTYTDTAGGTVGGTADAVDTTTASYYELDFEASTFTLRSTPSSSAAVGSTVSTTVRVLDQEGNPVQGYEVRFFRFGPARSGVGEARVTRTTNARGTATYTFLGSRVGTARVTAEVSDGTDRRSLTCTVRFGAPVRARLTGVAGGGRAADRLSVAVGRAAAGARAVLFRVDGDTRRAVRSRRLDGDGVASFAAVGDRNGSKRTAYVVRVGATRSTATATSNTVRVR